MSSQGSVYIGTSVYLPDGQTVLEHERLKARRVTHRRDGSVVLAYGSALREIPKGEGLFIPHEDWESAAMELAAVPFQRAELRARGGWLNMRLSLWPETGPIHVLLTSEMLAASSSWRADIYISTSTTSQNDDSDNEGQIAIRVSGVLAGRSALSRIAGQEVFESNRIVESDSLARQEEFEVSFNHALEGLTRLLRSAGGRPQILVEYGKGDQNSGVVVSSHMLEHLCSIDGELLISAEL